MLIFEQWKLTMVSIQCSQRTESNDLLRAVGGVAPRSKRVGKKTTTGDDDING